MNLSNSPLSKNNDPITSYIAEDKVKRNGTVERECNTILEAISAYPLHTCGELSHLVQIDDYSLDNNYTVYQKRVSVLERENKIKRHPKRKCTRKGTLQTVWEAV